MKKFILPLLFVLFLPALGKAQLFFVDKASGNNSNNGTTMSSAWQTIQYAMDNATPGSTVYIRGNTYYEQLELNVSGTSGNPIKFTNYNGENVYIDGSNGPGTLLYINNAHYISIEGLVFQNILGNNGAGVYIEGAPTYFSFRKNKIRQINWTINPATTPGSNNNSNPFVLYGNLPNTAASYISIDSNEIYNNITGFSESLTLDGNIDGFSITHNLVHDNTNIGILCAGNYQVSSNASTDHARNGVVQNNTTYNCVSAYATSGGIYVDGGQNIIVERNKTYGNGYGIEIGCEQPGTTSYITVRDNIIFSNQGPGLAIGGYDYPTTGQVLHCTIENNTFYINDTTNSGNGELMISKVGNSIFRNNIFYCSDQNIVFASAYGDVQTNLFNYNNYYLSNGTESTLTFLFNTTTYNGLAVFKSSTSQETDGFFGNPSFVSPGLADFHLYAGSPCIDAGAPNHIITYSETDYAGNNRVFNSIIDIGAYEYSGTSTDTKEPTNISPISFFPNPAQNQVSITKSSSILVHKISIYNHTGRLVLMTTSDSSIRMEDLPSGMYTVLIDTNQGQYHSKIVKQ